MILIFILFLRINLFVRIVRGRNDPSHADSLRMTSVRIDPHLCHPPYRKVLRQGTNAFAIGRSPALPNPNICVPEVVRAMNHVEPLTTVGSNRPSPS